LRACHKKLDSIAEICLPTLQCRNLSNQGNFSPLNECATDTLSKIRPDVATVYALQEAAQAWKDIAGNLPGVHGMSPRGPGAARRKSHGKIVLRVA
jgi:hypothetical protein